LILSSKQSVSGEDYFIGSHIKESNKV
jgi:hypothetical protein